MSDLEELLREIADRQNMLGEPTTVIVCVGPPECYLQDTRCSHCERFDIARDGTIKRQCDA